MFIEDPSVTACFTRKVLSAAGQLMRAPIDPQPPVTVYTITVFQTDIAWKWPLPHIDHAIEQDKHKTFPPPFQVGCLIYLNDVPEHSGGTVVWPESYRELESLAKAFPGKYEYLSQLNEDIGTLTLSQPLEIAAAGGDVLLYHYLCAHAGSTNAGDRPRAALNHKW